MKNEEVEEVLVVEPPDPDEDCKVEIIEDWWDDLEKLLQGLDVVVMGEWMPEMESDENLFSTSTGRHQKKQCLICLHGSGFNLN